MHDMMSDWPLDPSIAVKFTSRGEVAKVTVARGTGKSLRV